MERAQEQIRHRAAELLQSGEVATFLGWEAGRFANQTAPTAITRPEDAEKLVWNRYCVNTLAKYVDYVRGHGRVGIVARGCDSRAIIRLLVDQVIDRSDVYIIGVGCPGMLDRATGELLKKCAQCRHNNPLEYDEMVGDACDPLPPVGRFAEIEAVEAMPREERAAYFESVWAKCIRCYACRDVCPCCTCRECFVDQRREDWVGKQNNVAENRFYGLTRVMHVADRCIECGECERVCPMNLPLMQLNRKVIKDMCELFGEYEAGVSVENDDEKLLAYRTDDVEEFM